MPLAAAPAFAQTPCQQTRMDDRRADRAEDAARDAAQQVRHNEEAADSTGCQ